VSRRRQLRPVSSGFPPQLAEFNVADWWVKDPEDPVEVGYARVNWTAARRVYLEGGDWESYLLMPAWWAFHVPKSQTCTSGERVDDPGT
jgi:hypothetical protein